MSDPQERTWWRLCDRARAWAERPDPDDTELAALAAGALLVLAVANLRACLRWLFARRSPRSRPAVRGVIVAPLVGADAACHTRMCILPGRRRWWRRVRIGYLVSRLHLETHEGRRLITLPPGPIAIAGKPRRARGGVGRGLMIPFEVGDRVEVRAALCPGAPIGAPYRGIPALVALGVAELRVVGE